jgi:hypothetical protein
MALARRASVVEFDAHSAKCRTASSSWWGANQTVGDYLLAFILHKNGIAQPAVTFPTNYSHKRNKLGNSYYMVEPVCPR